MYLDILRVSRNDDPDADDDMRNQMCTFDCHNNSGLNSRISYGGVAEAYIDEDAPLTAHGNTT